MDSDLSVVAIIDDDVSMRESIEGLINSFDLATSTFASAHEFLQADLSPNLACLVVDVQMPGMGGLDLQTVLNEARRSLPIIFVTSFPDPTTRARALAAGALCMLGKPVDRDELIRHINIALDRSTAAD